MQITRCLTVHIQYLDPLNLMVRLPPPSNDSQIASHLPQFPSLILNERGRLTTRSSYPQSLVAPTPIVKKPAVPTRQLTLLLPLNTQRLPR